MQKDIKLMAMMVAAVMLAGYAMYALRDVDVVNQARNGFDTGVL